MSATLPSRLMKNDLHFVLEKPVSLWMRIALRCWRGNTAIRQKRDDGGIGKTFAAYLHRADEGTLSRLLVGTSILLAASWTNVATVLRDAASLYKVDTDAIAIKVKQELACYRAGSFLLYARLSSPQACRRLRAPDQPDQPTGWIPAGHVLT